jgi:hypothetical protein
MELLNLILDFLVLILPVGSLLVFGVMKASEHLQPIELPVSGGGDLSQTCWLGHTIITKPRKLIELAKKVNAEYFNDNDGSDKSNFDFIFLNSEGNVFTVYDWKEYRPLDLDENVEFHIGAHNNENASQGVIDLNKALDQLN